jgi:RNA polymerase sigma-70 factor (ECF subfamily)
VIEVSTEVTAKAAPAPAESVRAVLDRAYQAYHDRIYRLALGLLGESGEAEEIVQEAFLRLTRSYHGFNGRSTLGTWLYRVAFNASVDRLRKRGALQVVPFDDDVSWDDVAAPRRFNEWSMSPEEMVVNEESRGVVRHAIGELAMGTRAVFLMRDVEGLSTSETATALGVSTGAVKVRLHRARLALRERLAEYFAERTVSGGTEAQ